MSYFVKYRKLVDRRRDELTYNLEKLREVPANLNNTIMQIEREANKTIEDLTVIANHLKSGNQKYAGLEMHNLTKVIKQLTKELKGDSEKFNNAQLTYEDLKQISSQKQLEIDRVFSAAKNLLPQNPKVLNRVSSVYDTHTGRQHKVSSH